MAQHSQDNMMDSMTEFINFDQMDNIFSPGVSPHPVAKAQFAARPSTGVSTPSTLPSSTMAGPSHQYDMYKQQTPLVPGALASTMAVNQNNSQVSGYSLDYLSPQQPDDMFDFNATPPHGDGLDMDVNQSMYFNNGEQTVNPNSLEGQDSHIQSPTVPSQTSNVGRMYPGMHQQQAAALQMRKQQQQQSSPQGGRREPADPLVEAKITQILNQYRNKADGSENGDSLITSVNRPKKDEEDMDEDERLLASEEGKKLSSKERRQLRNKVSARAFRSRRKEYITHLEAEITRSNNEKQELITKNQALSEENMRLASLTRTLLSSSAFSKFIEELTTPEMAMNAAQAPAPQQQQPQVKIEQRQQQMHKDVNPYTQQQGNMATISEQPMDMNMMNMDGGDYGFQPSVYTVMDLPEIDIAALSGKDTVASEEFPAFDDEKIQVPVIESPVAPSDKTETLEAPSPTAEKANVDLDGDIFEDEVEESTSTEAETDDLSTMNIFGSIAPEKVFARYVLVDVADGETVASMAVKRVEQLAASLEAPLDRLNRLTGQI